MQGNGAVILVAFLICTAAILLAMGFVARTTHGPSASQSEIQPKGYTLRRGWLWALAAVTVIALAISIPAFPYQTQRQSQERHIAVVAMQYGFSLPAIVPLNTPIVFDVTSKDVNHGFGIYDPGSHLVAQVQAMPLYVNHLPVRFTVPGHYTVRCLEYCGIAHSFMQGAFEVR